MLLKSRSTKLIVFLSLIVLVLFLGLGLKMHRDSAHQFEAEGYILDYDVEEEEKSASRQLWFAADGRWSVSALDTVSFKDIQNVEIQTEEDSFVHYTDGSLAAFSESVLSDMDEYETGHIQHYNMPAGWRLSAEGTYAYTLKLGEREIGLSNLLWKAGDLSYLAASASLQLHFGDGRDEYLSSGYAELRYLDAERNAAVLSDGVTVWQVLTQGAYLRLENGVTLDLASGNLFRTQDDYDLMQDILSGKSLENAPVCVNIQEDFSIGGSENTMVYSPAQIPAFRFHVTNGTDGADGIAGSDGAEGETGAAGESGAEGAAGSEGASGDTNIGVGTIGAAGHDGEDKEVNQDDSSLVQNNLPTVKIKEWSLNGKSLMFTLAVDDSQVQYFTSLGTDGEEDPNSTRVSIVDADTGREVYYWTKEGCFSPEEPDVPIMQEQIDLTVMNSEGWALISPELELSKTYRLVVKANYQLNGVTGTQTFVDRSFTTDSYGITSQLVSRTDHSLTVALHAGNERVKIQSVSAVRISGDGLPEETVSGEYDLEKASAFMIDMGGNDYSEGSDTARGTAYTGLEANFANRYYDVTYDLLLEINTYNENGELSTERDVPYTLTSRYRTLKTAPTVGGLDLIPYNEGYFEAKLCGDFSEALLSEDKKEVYQLKYKDVFDPDGAIESATFFLYEVDDRGKRAEKPVAAEKADEGNVAYFVTNEIENFSETKTYQAEAVYTYNDGEKTVEFPVLETYAKLPDQKYDSKLEEAHSMEKGKAAWVRANLAYVFQSSVKFVGAEDWHNTGNDTTKGTIYNALHGSILVDFGGGGTEQVYFSNDYPLELMVSGAPDYNRMLQFYQATEEPGGTLLMSSEPAAAAPSQPESSNGRSLRMDLDQMAARLDGLRAGTAYTFTVYGYISDGKQGYIRSSLGSVVVRTDSEKNIDLAMRAAEGIGSDSLGIDFVLGTDSYSNITGDRKVPAPDSSESGDISSDYMQKIDVSYRSLAGITFYLYKENADGSVNKVGYCLIKDDRLTNPETNVLYDSFYGDNAGNTYRSYISEPFGNLKGMVGVGEKFYHRFRDPETNEELTAGDLTTGNYYITAENSYDYTYYRTQKTNRDKYNYYAYNYEDDQYINYLTVNGRGELAGAEPVEVKANDSRNSIRKYIQATPYPLPEVVRKENEDSGITAAYITNQEAGKADLKPEEVRDTMLDAATKVGIRLNTTYKNDQEYYTSTLTYYGFDKEEYELIDPEEELTPEKAYRYGLKYTIDMRDRESVPEVWILGYDASEGSEEAAALAACADGQETPPIGMQVKRRTAADAGYDYCAEVKLDSGAAVYILYVPEKSEKFAFRRGNSYVFSFETELDSRYKWSYQGESQEQTRNFIYPNDHYLAYTMDSEVAGKISEAVKEWESQGKTESEISELKKALAEKLSVSKEYALVSQIRSLPRQVPVIYANLENTFSSAEAGTFGGRDEWSIHISDPDGAILPESLFGGADELCFYNNDSGILGDKKKPLKDPVGTTEDEAGEKKEYYLSLLSGAGPTTAEIQGNNDYYKKKGDGSPMLDLDGNLIPIERAKNTAERFIANLTGQTGSLQVRNLPEEGLYYQVRLAYRLDDDQPEVYGNLNLVEHDYVGEHTYQAYGTADNHLEVEQYLQEDRDQVKCYLGTTEEVRKAALDKFGSSDDMPDETDPEDKQYQTVRTYYQDHYYSAEGYRRFADSIAAIAVTAQKKEADGSYTDIVERDEEGALTDRPRTLWTVPSPTAAGDPREYKGRYEFNFRISSLDEMDRAVGKEPQYRAGDELLLTYTFYYTSGDGLRSWTERDDELAYGDTYSEKYYAVKHVGKRLYVNLQPNNNNSVTVMEDSRPAHSFLNIKLKNRTEQLPWFQNLEILSDIFCQDVKVRNWRLSGDAAGTNGNHLLGENHNYDAGKGSPIYEFLSLQPVEVEGMDPITIKSIAPSLQNLKVTEGILKAGFSAYIKNYNMISVPQGETPRLYYLIYDATDAANPTLAAAGFGQSLDEVQGQLDCTWEIGENKHYKLELYFKTTPSVETPVPPDKDLFGKYAPEGMKETMYWSKNPADKDALEAIEKAIKGDSDHFEKVAGSSKGIDLITSADLHVNFGKLNLGSEMAYLEKWLSAETSIEENVNPEELSSLSLVYTLEQCRIAEDVSPSDEDNWYTVIYDKDRIPAEEADELKFEGSSPDGKNTWAYYAAKEGIEQSQTAANGISNSFRFHYFPGGQVRPGNLYRMTVRLCYLQEDGTYKNVTAADKDGKKYVTSDRAAWTMKKTDDAQAMNSILQMRTAAGIENPGKEEKHYIDFTFNYREDSYTSPSGMYYIRLVKQEADGSDTVVEEDRYYPQLEEGSGKTKEYLMCEPYTRYHFCSLEPNSKYKLQLYGVPDFDYDGKANFNRNGAFNSNLQDPSVFDAEKYYGEDFTGKPEELQKDMEILKKFTDLPLELKKPGDTAGEEAKNLLLAESEYVETLHPGQTFNVGTYLGTYTIEEDTETADITDDGHLEIPFRGSYNCGNADTPVHCYAWYLDTRESGAESFVNSGEHSISSGSLFSYDEETQRIILTMEDVAYTSKEGKTTNLLSLKGSYELILEFYAADSLAEAKEKDLEPQTVTITLNFDK